MPLLWLLALLVFAAPAAGSTVQSWRLPVADPVVSGRFHLLPGRSFAAGQRRGVDLLAAPGASVTSACGGRVTYSGPVPRRGLGVTIRCGALVATHLGLGAATVRRGTVVVTGQPIGVVGAGGAVRLGARLASSRWRYVDPLGLLGDVHEQTPTLPLARAPRAPSSPEAIRSPAPSPLHRPAFARPPRSDAPPVSTLVWCGVALLAMGISVHWAVWRALPARSPVETASGPEAPLSDVPSTLDRSCRTT